MAMEKKPLMPYMVRILLVSVTIISIVWGFHQIAEPALPTNFRDKIIALDEIKDSSEPSLDMVMSHVFNITREPHPSGSNEISEVRQYLLAQIEKMGLNYEIQSFHRDLLGERLTEYTESLKKYPDSKTARDSFAQINYGYNSFEEFLTARYLADTEFQNILVKIGPENPGHSFLMMAHYDGVKGSPAASDDGIAVACLLETMRTLSFQGNLKNAVYFLITDGEEIGLIGADYYCRNPLVPQEDIDFVVNFEARGNRGVPFVLDADKTGKQKNKNIIKMLSQNLDKKWTFSWANEIFKIMPNNTDLTSFLRMNYRGVVFAMGGGVENYHQPTDSYENLSRRSAHQYLKASTELAGYFANVENFDIESSENAIVFPVWSGKALIFSEVGMKIFALIVSILALIFIIFSIIMKQAKIKNFIISLGVILFTLGITYPLFLSNNFIIKKLPHITNETTRLVIITALGLAIIIVLALSTTVILWLVAKKIFRLENSSLKLVLLFIFALCSIATAVLFNSASYIFSIPLLFALTSVCAEFFSKNIILHTILKALTIFISSILFVPVIITAQMAVPNYIYVFFCINHFCIFTNIMFDATAVQNNFRTKNDC